ncbi:MAG: enoyl-CoA hydratase/isomerase [Caulobacter sp.]|nr:enoyl-CoA hydratase/isomerase [Caulobacter sp.]
MYDQYKALKIEMRGAALWITFNDPPMNAMNDEAHHELSHVFRTISRDPAVRVVVITGAGDRAFSAGGNIQSMKDNIKNHARWVKGATEAREVVLNMLECDKPVVARINGHAMGVGATIALCSDITVMVDTAKIGDTHVKIGLVAGDGGALLWPHLVGITLARRYLLTGDLLTGKQAAEIGLVTQSCTAEELDGVVDGWVKRFETGATVALAGTKRALNMAIRQQAQGAMDAHMGLETYSQLSRDHEEAANAFLEKREPNFEGR